MTDSTLVAYRYHAAQAIENWAQTRKKPSRFLRQFAKTLPPGGAVLDYGCGIGVDLAWMSSWGLAVEGLDATPDFVEAARARNPKARIIQGRFETTRLASAQYDGIWCHASLIHLTPRQLTAELTKLCRAIKPGGFLGSVFAWGRRKDIAQSDWIPGRYVACYTHQELARFFGKWEIVSLKSSCNDVRPGRWVELLAKRKGFAASGC